MHDDFLHHGGYFIVGSSSETRRLSFPFSELRITNKNKDKFIEKCFRIKSRHVLEV